MNRWILGDLGIFLELPYLLDCRSELERINKNIKKLSQKPGINHRFWKNDKKMWKITSRIAKYNCQHRFDRYLSLIGKGLTPLNDLSKGNLEILGIKYVSFFYFEHIHDHNIIKKLVQYFQDKYGKIQHISEETPYLSGTLMYVFYICPEKKSKIFNLNLDYGVFSLVAYL